MSEITAPLMSKTPVVIKQGRCIITIYDVSGFMTFTLTDLRKLWKIMFDAAWENVETIKTVKAWLPEVIAYTEAVIHDEQAFFRQKAKETGRTLK